LAVFGINMRSSSGVSVTLDTLAVVVVDSGTRTGDFDPLVDLAPITTTAASGVAIFIDTGTGPAGSFDAADPVAGVVSVAQTAAGANSRRYEFTFSPGIAVPQNDSGAEAGDDLFVALNISNAIRFRDDFVVSIPAGAFGFSGFTTKQPQPETSPLLVAGLPIFLTAVGDTSIQTDSRPLAVIGIDAADTTQEGNGGVNLTVVRVTFTDVSSFTLTDLQPLSNDTFSGVAVYRDNGATNGVYDPPTAAAPDAFIPLTGAPTVSGNVVTLTIAGAGSPVPDTNLGSESGPDWHVVIRARTTCSVIGPDRFRVGIAAGGLTFSTPFACETTVTSGIIGCTGIPPTGAFSLSPFVYSPNGDGRADTTAITLLFSDDTSFQIRVIDAAGNVAGRIQGRARGNQTTRVIIGRPTGSAACPAAAGAGGESLPCLPMRQYDVAIDFGLVNGETGTDSSLTTTTKLSVDLLADTPTFDTIAVSGNQVTITARHRLDDCPQAPDSATLLLRSACLAGEEAERSVDTSLLEVFANGVLIDTLVLPRGSTPASRTITLPSGIVTLTGRLTDAVGNRTDTPFAIGAPINTLGTGTLNVFFEGNAPVFYKSPANPAFTFTFPGRTTGAPFIEIYNLAGNRVRRINIPTGATTADWDGANDAGQVLRNGVYMLRFNVPLEGGVSIQERRTIVLMK
jgi:hypothetical protein